MNGGCAPWLQPDENNVRRPRKREREREKEGGALPVAEGGRESAAWCGGCRRRRREGGVAGAEEEEREDDEEGVGGFLL